MSSAVPISPVGPVAAATMVFRDSGALYVAAIVKATFAFAHHAVMPLAPPEPIFTRESHRMNNPTRSIVATSDLVPRMPAADVLVLGHAHAPGGSAAEVQVRLVVGRGESTILDKTVHVVGDRKGAEIKPFRSMPLAYEKAYGGPGCRDNPLGTGVLQGDAPPNIVDPQAPDRVVGLGPISRSWPLRSSLAPADVRAGLDRPIAEIPPGFDLRYFHAAPPDQRVSHLLGDEWIVLEGMHPSMPRVHLQLPGAQARTRIVGGEADGRVFSLRADTLRIDADAERCVVVWRNAFPVREADLGSFRLLAGLELFDAPIAWPEQASARGPAIASGQDDAPPPTQVLPPAMQRSIERAAGGTIVLSDEPALASTFSGTMEIADDEIESVHFDGPIEVQAPAPPADFSQTTVLGEQPAPSTTPLPAFWQRSGPPQAPVAAPSRAHPAHDVRQSPPRDVRQSPPRDVRRSPPRDPKEGTLDLSNFVASGAAIPFSGSRASGPEAAPPSAPPPLSATPIPGSPWDPNRFAGMPLEEASTAEADALDLAGTLASPTRSPVAEPPPMVSPGPPPVSPGPPPTAALPEPPAASPAPPTAALPEPPAASPAPPTAALPEPPPVASPAPLQASPADPPTAPLPEPVAGLADPPTAPLPDPWGKALREAEPPAPAPARSAPKPAEQGPSVQSSLYKRFKK